MIQHLFLKFQNKFLFYRFFKIQASKSNQTFLQTYLSMKKLWQLRMDCLDLEFFEIFFSDHVPGSLGIFKSLLCSSISLTILRVAELEMSPGIGLFWFCLWKSILIEKNKQGSANKKFENQKFTSKNSFRMHQLFGSNWLQRFRACFSAKCLRPIFAKSFWF